MLIADDLIKQLYDSGMTLDQIEVVYNCLDDYYGGRSDLAMGDNS